MLLGDWEVSRIHRIIAQMIAEERRFATVIMVFIKLFCCLPSFFRPFPRILPISPDPSCPASPDLTPLLKLVCRTLNPWIWPSPWNWVFRPLRKKIAAFGFVMSKAVAARPALLRHLAKREELSVLRSWVREEANPSSGLRGDGLFVSTFKREGSGVRVETPFFRGRVCLPVIVPPAPCLQIPSSTVGHRAPAPFPPMWGRPSGMRCSE